MKRKLYTMICLLALMLASQGLDAKSMKDLWLSMPDSLAPSLNKNMRTELVELQEMGVKSEVSNLLGFNTVLDTMTVDFAQVRLSKAATMQVKLLPQLQGKDSLLCVVKTYAAPEKESEVMFFDQQWKSLPLQDFFAGKSLDDILATLIQKPDTMTEARFGELKAMIEPKMMSATLFQHEDMIVFRLSLPLLSAEDKKQVNAIKVQRKLKWDGKTFNEG